MIFYHLLESLLNSLGKHPLALLITVCPFVHGSINYNYVTNIISLGINHKRRVNFLFMKKIKHHTKKESHHWSTVSKEENKSEFFLDFIEHFRNNI